MTGEMQLLSLNNCYFVQVLWNDLTFNSKPCLSQLTKKPTRLKFCCLYLRSGIREKNGPCHSMLVNTIITKKSLAYNLQFSSLKYASSIYPLWIFCTSFQSMLYQKTRGKKRRRLKSLLKLCAYTRKSFDTALQLAKSSLPCRIICDRTAPAYKFQKFSKRDNYNSFPLTRILIKTEAPSLIGLSS